MLKQTAVRHNMNTTLEIFIHQNVTLTVGLVNRENRTNKTEKINRENKTEKINRENKTQTRQCGN